MSFKDKHSLENRTREASKIRSKYPDRIPVIVEPSAKCTFVIERRKYLIPNDLTVGQLSYVIRKRINMEADQALYFFVNNTIPPTGGLVSQLYHEHKDEDGFLYIIFNGESTFG